MPADNEKEKFKKEFTQRLIKFSLKIIKFCEELKKDKVFWSITDQLIRSSTSIGANATKLELESRIKS